jgi:hypothetical protein
MKNLIPICFICAVALVLEGHPYWAAANFVAGFIAAIIESVRE